MSLNPRRQFLAQASALGLLSVARDAWAQPAPAWPTRPVRLLVAYPPGGVSDVVARLLGERLLDVPWLYRGDGSSASSL